MNYPSGGKGFRRYEASSSYQRLFNNDPWMGGVLNNRWYLFFLEPDQKFVDECLQKHGRKIDESKGKYFGQSVKDPKHIFTVAHYAGQVKVTAFSHKWGPAIEFSH